MINGPSDHEATRENKTLCHRWSSLCWPPLIEVDTFVGSGLQTFEVVHTTSPGQSHLYRMHKPLSDHLLTPAV